MKKMFLRKEQKENGIRLGGELGGGGGVCKSQENIYFTSNMFLDCKGCVFEMK